MKFKDLIKSNALDLLHVFGVLLLSFGVWEIYAPAGLIVLGVVIAAETYIFASKN